MLGCRATKRTVLSQPSQSGPQDEVVNPADLEDFETAIASAVDKLKKELISLINKKFKELQDQISADRKTVSDFKAEFTAVRDELKADLSALQIAVDQTQDDLSTKSFASVLKSQPVKTELRSLIRDTDKRSRNIVISGLEPVLGQEDHITVSDLFESNLSVKPFIDPAKCKRVGKPRVNHPLKLLITLRTAEDVTNVLRVAKDLRKSSDPHIAATVYINKDMSPEESKAAYDERVKKRSTHPSSLPQVGASTLRAGAPSFRSSGHQSSSTQRSSVSPSRGFSAPLPSTP